MAPDPKCTCLSPTQLMQMMARNEVVQSRYPCPLHPEPTFPPGTFVDRIPIVHEETFGTTGEGPPTSARRKGSRDA